MALGDSYSSGAGLTPYLSGGVQCERSPRGYPSLVARDLVGVRLDFAACAGATTAEIAHQVVAARSSLSRASLVTLTAGGNDLGFSTLLRSCLGAVTSPASTTVHYYTSSAGPAPCTAAVANAAHLLGATVDPASGAVVGAPRVTARLLVAPSVLERRLESLVTSILRDTSRRRLVARVLVVSYPVLLASPSGPVCRVSDSPLRFSSTISLYPVVSSSAERELTAVNELLRRETAAVVRTLGRATARLALVYPTSFAPISCRTGESSDLNGLSVASLLSGGSFHPTASGQAVFASAVRASLRQRD